MGIFKEFKEFSIRGNVVDLAVGVIIGGAFGKIVTSVVSDILMPPLGILIGDSKFTELKITLRDAVLSTSGTVEKEAVTLNYGNFIQTIVDFTIVAFCVFLLVKAINTIRKQIAQEEVAAPPAPAEPSNQEKLLAEIRDLLKNRN
jgi:large conductance mechanosensitive channel